MGRPKTNKEWKISITAKFEPDLAREIDDLANANYAYRTRILEEIVKLGLVEFKKMNPKMEQQLKEWRNRQASGSEKKRTAA